MADNIRFQNGKTMEGVRLWRVKESQNATAVAEIIKEAKEAQSVDLLTFRKGQDLMIATGVGDLATIDTGDKFQLGDKKYRVQEIANQANTYRELSSRRAAVMVSGGFIGGLIGLSGGLAKLSSGQMYLKNAIKMMGARGLAGLSICTLLMSTIGILIAKTASNREQNQNLEKLEHMERINVIARQVDQE
ncbi:MAG: hypothetical protein HY692_07150 [Cyanobacteria bacterium NC_groundwater_1444_Ag_S-0.65um_54_12]|nr:hypothetical protein [Cyanobacteria bacterium NC_groundwater_1444_Ag_S-0.65um_54_12]